MNPFDEIAVEEVSSTETFSLQYYNRRMQIKNGRAHP